MPFFRVEIIYWCAILLTKFKNIKFEEARREVQKMEGKASSKTLQLWNVKLIAFNWVFVSHILSEIIPGDSWRLMFQLANLDTAVNKFNLGKKVDGAHTLHLVYTKPCFSLLLGKFTGKISVLIKNHVHLRQENNFGSIKLFEGLTIFFCWKRSPGISQHI